MKIRKISSSDIEKVSKLFDLYRVFYKKESDLKNAEKFLLERFENKESEIYVAESDENELAGFVQLYPIFSSTRMKRLWLLNDLFVSEKYRGQGISVLLIDEAKKLCRESNACGLVLETARSNEVGNKLYPKTGFSLDQGHNYYSWDIS
jgi:ribosomal protein S18 acetylase RimI-like enzyme